VTAKPMIQSIKEKIENLLYPELRPYERNERDRLLRVANKTPFDFIEWAGIPRRQGDVRDPSAGVRGMIPGSTY